MKVGGVLKNNRLKETRISKDLTQSELAELIGAKGKQSVSNWENGHSRPTLETALLLSNALGKDVEFLFGLKVQDSHTKEEAI